MSKIKIFILFLVIKICSFYQFEQGFGSRNSDLQNCALKENQCSEFIFTAKGFQCCNCAINKESKCYYMISPIKLAQDEETTENGKLLTKEYMGFTMIKDELEYLSYDFDCTDGKLSFKYELSNFSPEEQEKLKSPNHCINYNSEYSGEITKDICYKADLATTGNSGVSCGYYEFDIILEDNSKVKHQACFLFNDDIRTTKNIGYTIKQMAEQEAEQVATQKEKELSSYQMTGTNSKEKSFIYFSINDTVSIPSDVDPSDSGEPVKPSVSNFINTRYIFLLILFYILNI